MLPLFRPRRLPVACLRHIHVSSIAAAKALQKFRLADIGEGITECEIIRWNVKPSTTVQAFDPLCEVQSDKASVEITSPFDGVVKELLVEEGQVAKVGEGLCLIEVEEEDADGSSTSALQPDHSSPPHTPAKLASEPSVSPNEKRSRHPLDPTTEKLSLSKDEIVILSTPSVRHFAKQQGVKLSDIAPGSGKGGRIERRDVEAYLKRGATSPSITSERDSVSVDAQKDITLELSRTRLAMWKAMTKSLEIPHFGYSTYLDVTQLHGLLPLLSSNIPQQYLPEGMRNTNASQAVSQTAILGTPPKLPTTDPSLQYARLTMLPLLLKTLSKAMLEWPVLRSSIASTESPPSIIIRPHADISIALSTPTGLYTPTIQGVENMTPYEIMGHLRRLQTLGRQTPQSGLTLKDMPRRGGTVTVSNVGAIGRGEFASPILVPGGGVAIVAIGRARWMTDVEDEDLDASQSDSSDALVASRRLKVGVSWSADHRVVEGAELAAFVECWRSWVENPMRLIGEGR